MRSLSALKLRLCALGSALLLAPLAPAATTSLTESWNTAPTGAIASGPLAADNNWTVALGANAGNVAIVDLGGGDKTLEHQTTATGAASTHTFTTTLPVSQQIPITTGVLTFQFDTVILADPGTNSNRHLGYELKSSTGSLDGYAVRFAPRSDGCRLEVGTINNGAAPVYTQVNTTAPIQVLNKRLRVTVRIKPGTNSTAVDYHVYNVTDNTDFIPAATLTTPLSFVPDAGTVANTAVAFVRQNTRSQLDNLRVQRAAPILFESWNTAPTGVISSGPLAADNNWTVALGANAGTVAIADLGGGNKTLEHQTTATGAASTHTFTTTLPAAQQYGITSGKIIFEFEIVILADPGTNNNRHLGFQIQSSTGSLDGYAVRFAPRSDGCRLEVGTINNGAAPAYTQVNTVAPVQVLNKTLRARVTLRPGVTTTAVDFHVFNVTDGVDFIPAATLTTPLAFVPDPGTVVDTALAFVRQNTRSQFDNLNITKDDPPVVTVVGANPASVNCQDTYTDAGATALDDYDGDISHLIGASSTVNTSTPGAYTVTYTVTDSGGQQGQAVRNVNVLGPCGDVTPPVITLLGSTPVNHPCGTAYVDAGATAFDNVDGDITANIVTVNPVNSFFNGTYIVTYNVQDAAGNHATEVQRVVNVIGACPDVTPPVITLTGPSFIVLNCGASYTDQGATAFDNIDGDITANIVVNNPVNTGVPNVYTITYNVQDAAGNHATEVTRTVSILNNCPDLTNPVITLLGDNPLNLSCGQGYTEPGYTAFDNVDGDLTAQVIVGGDTILATTPPGTYAVTYNVTDSANNPANQVIRTVVIAPDCPLAITVNSPLSVQALSGDLVAMDTTVSGEVGSLALQWYFDDGSKSPQPILGQTSEDLTLVGVQPNSSGEYFLIAEDSVATVESAHITLLVEVRTPVAGIFGLGLLALAFAAVGCFLIRKKDHPAMNRFNLPLLATLCTAILGAPAQAGVVFTETWDGAPTGVIAMPGSLSSTAHNWTSFAIPATGFPELQITSFGGDLKLDNTVAGAGSSNQSYLRTASPLIDISKKVRVEFDIRDHTPATTSSQRFYVLIENTATQDGYRVRFSSQTQSEEVLNATIYDNGVEVADRKFDDNNNGLGGFGVPNQNGEWHIRMDFWKSGADTKVEYQVTGLNGTPNLLAKNTWTFTGVGVQDNFDAVQVWCRRPLAQIDNIVISVDNDPAVITLNGDNPINLDCGQTYTEPGATATDLFDGNLSSAIQISGAVNTTVPGTYTRTYQVTDSSGNVASVTRTVNVANNCPSIFINPTTPLLLRVEVGSSATFGVSAQGNGTMHYQWYFDDGVNPPQQILGAVNASYSIPAVDFPNEGTYYCEVTDDFDTVVSPLFTLDVTPEMPVAGALGLLMTSLATAMAGAAALRRRR